MARRANLMSEDVAALSPAQELEASAMTIRELTNHVNVIEAIALIVATAFTRGDKLLVAGNGGSAAAAQHFAAEFEGDFTGPQGPLPAMWVPANPSFVTAWSNDHTFDTAIARLVETYGRPGDVFMAVSTSGGSRDGSSRNLVLAAEKARSHGLSVVALSGKGGGVLANIAEACLTVASDSTARVQDAHQVVLHILSGLIGELVGRPSIG